MNSLTVRELLQTFHSISGMSVGLFDKRLRSIMGVGTQGKTLCNAVHSTPEGCGLCFRSDLEAVAEVERTRRIYVYTCPFGLLSAIAPILRHNEIIGYILVGKAISTDQGQRQHVIRAAMPYVGDDHTQETVSALVDTLEPLDGERFEALGKTLTLFAEYIAVNNLFPASEESIAQMIEEYIRQNYSERITLSALALYLHCSTVTLTENFKREYGTTIMQYVNDVRMAAAEELLISTECSVGAVAEQCGFASIEYFSKCFKKKHKISPIAYRREHLSGSK
ncbi:MAG: PocR ligand-binding domain-containing protein [Clostridia bacterium]|nr:PocR ligand-binding domain-containing protein [Clostridia bacterium]